jgi:hypothetical protein
MHALKKIWMAFDARQKLRIQWTIFFLLMLLLIMLDFLDKKKTFILL